VYLKEKLKQLPVRKFFGIKGDGNGLRMGAMVAVGSIGHITAGISYHRCYYTRNFPDQFFHSPKTTACQYCLFVRHMFCLVRRGTSLAPIIVTGCFPVILAAPVLLVRLVHKAGLNTKIGGKDYEEYSRKSTKDGKQLGAVFSKWELISVHTAWRSFATNACLQNMPSIFIMKITGPKTGRSFLKYIKILQEDNVNKLINHPFFSWRLNKPDLKRSHICM
jgi:hypothetical protein